jgi:hypothetical protein
MERADLHKRLSILTNGSFLPVFNSFIAKLGLTLPIED